MSVSIFNNNINQTAQFTKANSGYAPTVAGPTNNNFSAGFTSGKCLLVQQSLASGGDYQIDLFAGNNQDLVGTLINFSQLYSLQIQASSGAVQIETYQSGGWTVPQHVGAQSGYPISGYGVLVDPGAVYALGEQGGSGNTFLPVTADKGNIVLRAVSGAANVNVGAYGV